MNGWIIFFAMCLMVAQDAAGVFLVVAEARGRSILAGVIDGLSDWPKMLGAGIAGATLANEGFSATFLLVSAVSVTSVFSTSIATHYARRIKAANG